MILVIYTVSHAIIGAYLWDLFFNVDPFFYNKKYKYLNYGLFFGGLYGFLKKNRYFSLKLN